MLGLAGRREKQPAILHAKSKVDYGRGAISTGQSIGLSGGFSPAVRVPRVPVSRNASPDSITCDFSV